MLDLDSIPLDDAKTYQLFGEAPRMESFSLKARTVREILRKAKPQRLDDLIALNAMPSGPLRSGMVDDFIARKHGKVKVVYELKELEPILADTYGVIAYRNRSCASRSRSPGFTMGQADMLRKAMGKRSRSWPSSAKSSWTARKPKGSTKKGGEDFRADGIRSRCSFNKSHSTAYASSHIRPRI